MTQLDWVQVLQSVDEPILAPLSPTSDLHAWHISVEFDPWVQPAGSPALSRAETYGWKPQIIGSDSSRSVGEVELAQRFRRAGYNAYWIDTFGSAPEPWKKFIAKRDQLPPYAAGMLTKVQSAAGKKLGGAPDVIAWRNGESAVRFVEYKGPKDKIREGQDAWLRAALDQGLSPTSYVVATNGHPPRGTAR